MELFFMRKLFRITGMILENYAIAQLECFCFDTQKISEWSSLDVVNLTDCLPQEIAKITVGQFTEKYKLH